MSEVLNLTGLGNMNVNPSDVPDGDCLVTKQFIDNLASSINFFVGQIKMYCGKTLPSGWLFCNGQSLSKTTYKSLFDVIGTNYGQDPNNTNNFLLPNLTSRIPICSQQLDPINITYQGTNTYSSGNKTISTEQMTSHSHIIPDHSHGYSAPYNQSGCNRTSNASNARGTTQVIGDLEISDLQTTNWSSGNGNNNISISSGNTGEGKDFLPPFCVINFIIYYGSIN